MWRLLRMGGAAPLATGSSTFLGGGAWTNLSLLSAGHKEWGAAFCASAAQEHAGS